MQYSRFAGAALLALASGFALGARPAQAQDRSGTVEITPFGGGYFGGRLHAGSNALFSSDVDIADAGAWGLRVGMNANRWLGIEAGFSTAKADIRSIGGSTLFGSGQKLGRFEVQHYELDGLFNIGRRKVIPYIALGAGLTHFQAKVDGAGSSDDNRFTTNIGAGIKAYFNPHVAFRFDGRYRVAYLDNTDCDRHNSTCDDGRHGRDDNTRWYGSGEVTGGLTFAF